MAAGAVFTVAGAGSGERAVPAAAFFKGYRKVDLAPHEVLTKASCSFLQAACSALPALLMSCCRSVCVLGVRLHVPPPSVLTLPGPASAPAPPVDSMQVCVPFTRPHEYVKEFKQAHR